MRRVCCAVVTVAAAFVCILIQGLPLDFRDDNVVVGLSELEIDGNLLLGGLLGPHFHGLHSGRGQDKHTDEGGDEVRKIDDDGMSPFVMFLLEEDYASDVVVAPSLPSVLLDSYEDQNK